MKFPSRFSVAVLALVATGCAGSSHSGIQSTVQSYNGANFNGEWKLVPPSAGDKLPQDALWLFPSAFKISSDSQKLRFLDDSGNPLAEVALDSNYPYAAAMGSTRDVEDRPRATWVDSRTFSFARSVPDSFTVTRTFALDGSEKQLTVGLQVSGADAARTYKRVYKRV